MSGDRREPQMSQLASAAYAPPALDRLLEDPEAPAAAQAKAWIAALAESGPDRERALERAARAAAARGPVRARAGAGRRSPTSAARSSTTSRRRRPTTRWWRCWRSSATFAARAASPPGPTSSRCSRPGVRLRRRAWQDREVVLEPADWDGFADRAGPLQEALESAELLDALRVAIEGALTAISAGCSSPWRSTRCRSTCWPSGSTRPAGRSTRRSTTPGGGCARRSPSRG